MLLENNMLIIVTGAYGFIGSNLIKKLNQIGYTNIIAVDNLANGIKFKNLVNCQILEYCDKKDFLTKITNNYYQNIDFIFHQGACSNTMISDGEYMMHNNYEYSKILFEFAQQENIPLIYASSAAVYGNSNIFIENELYEQPMNIYGYSKLLFDQLVRSTIAAGVTAPVVGLRYFNVYGINEAHKAGMASMVFHSYQQFMNNKSVQLFEGSHGYQSGEHKRDFIYIDDVIDVIMFFMDNYILDPYDAISGIFNCGTGHASSFNQLALGTINAICNSNMNLADAIQREYIKYIPFPEKLSLQYQAHTQADISALLNCGFAQDFTSLDAGIAQYIKSLPLSPCTTTK
jgi:ADP-L-glycero-D-manno-heptose 6-epimerase